MRQVSSKARPFGRNSKSYFKAANSSLGLIANLQSTVNALQVSYAASVAVDDPTYRFSLDPQGFKALLVDPATFGANQRVTIPDDTVFIGSYLPRIGMSQAIIVTGVPGTKVCLVHIFGGPISTTLTRADLTDSPSLYNFLEGAPTMFGHLQLVDQEAPTAEPQSIDRSLGMAWASEVTLDPRHFLRSLSSKPAADQSFIRSPRFSEPQSHVAPLQMTASPSFVLGQSGNLMPLGFVIQANPNPTPICAMVETQFASTLSANDPLGAAAIKVNTTQLVIKSY